MAKQRTTPSKQIYGKTGSVNKYMEKQAVRQVCKFSKLAQNACFVPCSQKQKNSFNKDNAGEAAVKLCLWCYILVQLSENRSAICI